MAPFPSVGPLRLRGRAAQRGPAARGYRRDSAVLAHVAVHPGAQLGRSPELLVLQSESWPVTSANSLTTGCWCL